MVDVQQIPRTKGDFQQPVSEQQLLQQLNLVLPEQKIVRVTELQAGMFNNTYRISTASKDYILKVAPHADADVFYNERFLMQREQSLSRQLQAVSPLVPTYLGFFNIAGRNAFLQPLIPGRLWHDVVDELSTAENNRLWRQLGEFARTLHSCQGEDFGYPAPFARFAAWSDFILDNVHGMVKDCHRLGVMSREIDTYLGFLPQALAKLDEVKKPCLLHGDLWPRNVIIADTGKDICIKAVFDAERAFWGDPIADWVLLLYGVPDAFWQGYGENLLKNRDPVCQAVYQGMYFILNILETTRFESSIDAPRGWLAGANSRLAELVGGG